MKRLRTLWSMLALVAVPAVAEEPLSMAAYTPAPAANSARIEEVMVEAPEPRYVAPTLRDRIGRIWAPVLINGKGPFRLVLDTGASHSAIISRVATLLGIPPSENMVRLNGVTGTAIVPTIHVDQIEVGDLLLQGAHLPIVPDVFGGAEGVLGNVGLADKRIYIDFKRDRIEIVRARNQFDAGGYETLPLRIARNHLLTIDVRIGGVRTRAIVDTGAQQTIGNTALREALIRRARNVKEHEIVGVTLDVAKGESIATPPVLLGSDVVIRSMHITFTDVFIFQHWKMTHEPALLIGMDVLGLLEEMIIDYRSRKLHIRTRR